MKIQAVSQNISPKMKRRAYGQPMGQAHNSASAVRFGMDPFTLSFLIGMGVVVIPTVAGYSLSIAKHLTKGQRECRQALNTMINHFDNRTVVVKTPLKQGIQEGRIERECQLQIGDRDYEFNYVKSVVTDEKAKAALGELIEHYSLASSSHYSNEFHYTVWSRNGKVTQERLKFNQRYNDIEYDVSGIRIPGKAKTLFQKIDKLLNLRNPQKQINSLSTELQFIRKREH